MIDSEVMFFGALAFVATIVVAYAAPGVIRQHRIDMSFRVAEEQIARVVREFGVLVLALRDATKGAEALGQACAYEKKTEVGK